MASSLIVMAFDTEEEAEKVREALVSGKKQGLLQLDDAPSSSKMRPAKST